MLDEAWECPFFIASDFARANRHAVALAASLGWISNIKPDGLAYSPCWHLTHAGALALERRANP